MINEEYSKEELESLEKKIPMWDKKWKERGDCMGYILHKLIKNPEKRVTPKLIGGWLKEGVNNNEVANKRNPKKWLPKFTRFSVGDFGRILRRIEDGKQEYYIIPEFVKLYISIMENITDIVISGKKYPTIFEFSKHLMKTYQKMKNEFDLVSFSEIKEEICNDLNFSESEFMDYLNKADEKEIISYSLVSGRKIQRMKLIEGPNYERI